MSIRVDSSPLITGAVVVGVPGLGVLAEAVPSTGEHGAGYLYPSLEFPADAGKEVRGLITTWPTLGTLKAFEDSSFEYDGPTDSFAFQMYVDGVAVGTPQAVTVTVGAQVSITSDANSSYFVRDITQKDTSDDYAVRSSILQGVGDDYTVFNSVQNDVISAYSVRHEVEKDVVSSYVVEAAVGVVSKDTSSEYLIRSAVSETKLSTFIVRENVSQDSSDDYNVRSTVFEDKVGTCSILGVVSKDVTSSYEVLSASVVATNIDSTYVVCKAVVSSNEGDYFVRDTISSSVDDSYVVRDVVFQEVDDTFFIRSVISQTAEDDYLVVSVVTKDTSSSYEVLSDKTPVGNSTTSGYIIFNSVSGDVISYYNIFGGFAVVKRYNVTLDKENVFNITLQ